MSVLHTLNKSATGATSIGNLCKALAEEDSIMLIEDGVYHAGPAIHPLLKEALQNDIPIYARVSDVLARGIENEILTGIALIDDDAWVELVIDCRMAISWYT